MCICIQVWFYTLNINIPNKGNKSNNILYNITYINICDETINNTGYSMLLCYKYGCPTKTQADPCPPRKGCQDSGPLVVRGGLTE